MEIKIVYSGFIYNLFIDGKFIIGAVDYEDALDITKIYFDIREKENNSEKKQNKEL